MARVLEGLELGDLPDGTLARRWLRSSDIDGIPLVNEDLRRLLRAALDAAATA